MVRIVMRFIMAYPDVGEKPAPSAPTAPMGLKQHYV
jgi:hypothetical protein